MKNKMLTHQFKWQFFFLFIFLMQVACDQSPKIEKTAKFTGSESCMECHQKEYDLWLDSDHDMAMDTANSTTVLGNFNNQTYVSRDFEHRFYKKDSAYWVHTCGPDGKPTEFQIAYTFGVRPLQQYLIKFDKGRLQCLPIAWDTDKNKWFDIYKMIDPDLVIEPEDWLYWTNQAQNWNSMCAECHSTNLRKNFDPETQSYNTKWSEIHVGCEACHGPGSLHNIWAQTDSTARPDVPNFHLTTKTSEIEPKTFVEGCAYCHSRRTVYDDFTGIETHMLNHFSPTLPTEPSYYPDGQIKEEVYVYGSFLQSRMHADSIKCNNCHDSHSLKLKFEGNALCLQCHEANKYDTYDHHFHKYENAKSLKLKSGKVYEVGTGTLCIECHMPGAYFMGNDFRRDHSLRIPRPDLSIAYGVPNACNLCHEDNSSEWALEKVEKWYGKKQYDHFSQAFAEFQRTDYPDLSMMQVLQVDTLPLLIQASALEVAGRYQLAEYIPFFDSALKDKEPLMRQMAVRHIYHPDTEKIKNLVQPLLTDSIKAVRTESVLKMGTLSLIPDDSFNNVFIIAKNEMLDALNYSADFPATQYTLGNFYHGQGDIVQAEKHFRIASEIDRRFFPARINLALLLNANGNNTEAEKILKEIIDLNSAVPDANYYLGLLLIEKGNSIEGIKHLEKASELMSWNPRVFYNLGLALEGEKKYTNAEEALIKAIELSNNHPDYAYTLAYHYYQRGLNSTAIPILQQILMDFPEMQSAIQLLETIEKK